MFVHVLQLFEYNAVLEVEIMEWTTAGLVSRIEVRVVLPCAKCVFLDDFSRVFFQLHMNYWK